MKFLCDQMLADVGKWLRVAGYDTEIISQGEKDEEIAARALREDRILLTRDQNLKGIHLKHNSLEETIADLNSQIAINWLYKPFSRCIICNAVLEERDGSTYCPICQKLYWLGSHTDRMLEQLKAFQKSVP